MKTPKDETQSILHGFYKILVDFRSPIPRNLESPWSGDTKMVENRTNKTSIPEQGLSRQIIDTEWFSYLDIVNGLVEREIS